MSGLREALETLARGLRSDAANHGADIRNPRLVLENRAADVDRILAAHPAESAPVASRERVAEVLAAWLDASDNEPVNFGTTAQLPAEYRALADEGAAALAEADVFRDEAEVIEDLLTPLYTALDPYIEDNDHAVDHEAGGSGDCNRCVAEEAYEALGLSTSGDVSETGGDQ